MPDRYSRIFLLSHMRAYTSLAGHILGSHPAINGYFEMHISYGEETALIRQLAIYQQHESLKAGSHYIFDKLLHNDYRLNTAIKNLADSRILLSLLQPEHSIKSIVNLFTNKEGDELYASPHEAARYYIERVEFLADFCLALEHPYYYYDAECIQATPHKLLPALGAWLQLDTPLNENYQLFSHTGKAGMGDSSPHIHHGRIDRKRSDYSHIHIEPTLLDAAQRAYHDSREQILKGSSDSLTLD